LKRPELEVATIEDRRRFLSAVLFGRGIPELFEETMEPSEQTYSREEVFGFDGFGSRILERSPEVTYTVMHDELGRPIQRTDSRFDKAQRFTYDEEGRLRSLTDLAGGITQYRYEAAGRLSAVSTPDGTQIERFYDRAGRLMAQHWSQGASARLAYTAAGRVEQIRHLSATGAELGEQTYQYDANGNRERVTFADASQEVYEYDPVDRLKKVTYADQSVQEFRYDDAGNRTWQNDRGVQSWLFYDEANRLQRIAANPQGTVLRWGADYDDNGNREAEAQLPAGPVRTFSYDAANRLVGVADAPGGTWSFAYDALGQRIRQVAPEKTRDYTWAAGNRIGEYQGTSLFARYSYGPALDELLLVHQGGAAQIPQQSAVQSLVGLSDASGSETASFRYDVFGRVRSTTGVSEIDLRFTAREADSTQLVYLRARHYDPRTGRFLNPDPIGLAGGSLNLYVYAANSPATFTDPSGNIVFGQSVTSIPVPTPEQQLISSQSRYPFSIPTAPGAGTVSGGLFIQNPRVALFGNGDARGMDANATPDQFRVFFEANFETGQGFLQSNPSCVAVVGCAAPLPFNTAGSPNRFTVNPTANGFLLGIHAANAQDRGGLLGEIDADFFVQANGPHAATGVAILEPFPSAQLFQFQGSRVTELLRFTEDALGPDLFKIPNLEGDRTVVPFTNIPVR
jgi:RHS repeat-associated protein